MCSACILGRTITSPQRSSSWIGMLRKTDMKPISATKDVIMRYTWATRANATPPSSGRSFAIRSGKQAINNGFKNDPLAFPIIPVTGQPYDSNKNPLHNSFVRRIYFRRKRLCKYAYKRVAGWGIKKFYDKIRPHGIQQPPCMFQLSHWAPPSTACHKCSGSEPLLKKLLSEP